LRELANERRRFGYRRLFILLRREGEPSGINRIYRLYHEEGLAVRKRRSRRRAVGTRAPILVEARPNARWSLDFVHDQFACGRRFRVLNIVDDVTRECLAAIPDTSISGRRVARELTALLARRQRSGNRNFSVPGEIFRSRDGTWLMISVATEKNWQQLATAMSRVDWLADKSLLENSGRLPRTEELHAAIAEWVAEFDAQSIEERMNAAGVPCSRLFTAIDMANDPYLAHRGSLITVNTTELGDLVMPAPVGKLQRAPSQIKDAGPSLGEHNREVFGGLLAMSDDEINALSRMS
jgi:transposase InsO family protein